jgi:hypothetical protein
MNIKRLGCQNSLSFSLSFIRAAKISRQQNGKNGDCDGEFVPLCQALISFSLPSALFFCCEHKVFLTPLSKSKRDVEGALHKERAPLLLAHILLMFLSCKISFQDK